jgi:glyoxylase-like metal-dependent hydrolase (beta-lactamase superfamily II)
VNVGDIRVDSVLDGAARVPPTLAYGAPLGNLNGKGTDEADWSPHRGLLDAEGMVELALGAFLLRGGPLGERVVLVDAGCGPRGFGAFESGAMLGSLAALGVATSDVTDVVFTHLHFDHVGWASRDGDAVFANATYRCDAADWAHFVDTPATDRGHERSLRYITPVADRFEMFSGTRPLFPGVDVRLAPGHTPGSTLVIVSHGPARAILLGDVVHCPVELLEDDWGTIGDVDPPLARRTRESLARELEGTDVPIAAAHFPGLQFGRLLPGQGRRSWVV